jgi:signal recognition particle subunit SRP54
MIIKIINDEMVAALNSPENEQKINLHPKSLSTLLMVGLQGSGKTTSTAKLAAFFKSQHKKVVLISADTYRPAARQQLEILAEAIQVDFFQTSNNNPLEITKQGLAFALREKYDIAIFDTAGRLQIDADMIREAQEIKHICNPCETLLVIDSLSGQNAFTVASEFDKALGVSGSILTRVDGDSRGGAALSVRHITNKPIKFLGTGEKTSALELFDAKRIAGRIIGMGDVVSLVEKAAETISKEEAEKATERLQKGIFTLEDYLDQIRNLKKMGGLSSVMKMMPGLAGMQDKINSSGIGNSFTEKQEAIILSMTKKERRNTNILNASRKNRIAKGSGASVSDVQKLLKQFDQMQTMMKKASKMNLSSLIGKSGIGGLFS